LYRTLVAETRRCVADDQFYVPEAVIDYDPSQDPEKICVRLVAMNWR
jgi:hypothetical protein